MSMHKLLLFLFSIICFGCQNSNSSDVIDYSENIHLHLSEQAVEAEGAGSVITLEIEVDDLSFLEFVAVRKLKNNEPVRRMEDMPKNKFINNKQVFEYTIQEEDIKGDLAFSFIPVDINNHYGKETNVQVDILSRTKQLYPTDAVKIARITGKSLPGEILPNPNVTHEKYNIGGTDLGIFWIMEENKVGMVFGDTFGKDWYPGNTPDWRSNVLAISSDLNLDDGITFDKMICEPDKNAKQIIYSAHDTSGKGDYSSIPTAGIRLNGTDYIHYMNVKAWTPNWITNYSGYAVSTDDGESWNLQPNLFSTSSKFAQLSLWARENWIYTIGSIVGRRGLPYLARFKADNILHPDKYEYWNKDKGWLVGDETSVTPLFGNYINEMYAEPTLVYSEYYKRWITVYFNEIKYELVMRDAEEITGPWSEEKVIITGKDYPKLYGGFIYPLNLDKPGIYISLSQWDPLYNVFLMKVNLQYIKE